jgi:hypothetical protein
MMHGAEIQVLQTMPLLSFKAANCDGRFTSLRWHQCKKKSIPNDDRTGNLGRSMGVAQSLPWRMYSAHRGFEYHRKVEADITSASTLGFAI